jgi:hypothetical protein
MFLDLPLISQVHNPEHGFGVAGNLLNFIRRHLKNLFLLFATNLPAACLPAKAGQRQGH